MNVYAYTVITTEAVMMTIPRNTGALRKANREAIARVTAATRIPVLKIEYNIFQPFNC
jgi:hypothetical protein